MLLFKAGIVLRLVWIAAGVRALPLVTVVTVAVVPVLTVVVIWLTFWPVNVPMNVMSN